METNLIGFAGCKQSGKNTVAKIWQLLANFHSRGEDYWLKEYTDTQFVLEEVNKNINYDGGWQQKSFAHKLKQILCILTDCNIEQLENESIKSLSLQELCDKGIITSTWIKDLPDE